MSIRLRSRWGSIVLALTGAAYAIAGTVMLVWSVATTWSFAGMKEFLVYMALGFAAVIGVWFVSVAAHALTRHASRRASSVSS